MTSKTFVTYVKKNLVLMKMIKTIKSDIIVITMASLEEMLVVFAIKDTKHQKKFHQYFVMVIHMTIT